jgi:hypothetical protein
MQGADRHAVNTDGRRPRDVASDRGLTQFVQEIDDFDAQNGLPAQSSSVQENTIGGQVSVAPPSEQASPGLWSSLKTIWGPENVSAPKYHGMCAHSLPLKLCNEYTRARMARIEQRSWPRETWVQIVANARSNGHSLSPDCMVSSKASRVQLLTSLCDHLKIPLRSWWTPWMLWPNVGHSSKNDSTLCGRRCLRTRQMLR